MPLTNVPALLSRSVRINRPFSTAILQCCGETAASCRRIALEEALPRQTVTSRENSVFRNGPLKARSLGCTAGPFMQRLQRYRTTRWRQDSSRKSRPVPAELSEGIVRLYDRNVSPHLHGLRPSCGYVSINSLPF